MKIFKISTKTNAFSYSFSKSFSKKQISQKLMIFYEAKIMLTFLAKNEDFFKKLSQILWNHQFCPINFLNCFSYVRVTNISNCDEAYLWPQNTYVGFFFSCYNLFLILSQKKLWFIYNTQLLCRTFLVRSMVPCL